MSRRRLGSACLVATPALVVFGAGAQAPLAASATVPVISSVLWMGDSIAWELAPGVEYALETAGLRVVPHAYPGVSLTHDAILPDGDTWMDDHHAPTLAWTPADVVVWQLSLFDTLSSKDVLMQAHTEFVDLALRNHLAVVFVTGPPLHEAAAIATATDWTVVNEVAYAVAERHPGRVFVADSSAVWGTSFVEQTPDGILRKRDGVHICQLGATLFADFLARWLSERFDGFTPADISTWSMSWWSDFRFYLPPDACTAR